MEILSSHRFSCGANASPVVPRSVTVISTLWSDIRTTPTLYRCIILGSGDGEPPKNTHMYCIPPYFSTSSIKPLPLPLPLPPIFSRSSDSSSSLSYAPPQATSRMRGISMLGERGNKQNRRHSSYRDCVVLEFQSVRVPYLNLAHLPSPTSTCLPSLSPFSPLPPAFS